MSVALGREQNGGAPGAERTATDPPILRVSRLTKTYDPPGIFDRLRRKPGTPLAALKDVSLDIWRGESVGIVGESGSGKSTLAQTIVGLIDPDSGTVELDGQNIAALRKADYSALPRRVQLIYQDPYTSLNPAMKIAEAIGEPAKVHKLVAPDQVDRRVSELMEQVGLRPTLAGRLPRALSGGQRQRVAIARSLAVEPEILIADEAVSALDVSIQAQIISLLAGLKSEFDLTLVFISHQLATVAQLCSRVVIMYRGEIVETGQTREVFSNPKHDYTAALLKAHPGQKRRRTGLDKQHSATE